MARRGSPAHKRALRAAARRPRTPAQQAASRANLKKANAARKGSVTLYHNTTEANAGKILVEGFKGRVPSAWDLAGGGGGGKDAKRVYFSDKRRGMNRTGLWGETQLQVTVPRTQLRRGWRQPPKAYKEKWYTVHERNLKNTKAIKLKRNLAPKGLTAKQKRLGAAHQARLQDTM